MGGESPPLKNGERHYWKAERWCGRGCTGLTYLGISMMEELNELIGFPWVSRSDTRACDWSRVPPRVLWA